MGNFGVSSNVGGVSDTKQFPGWFSDGSKFYWFACERDFPPPDCSAYNANNCTEQESWAPDQGENGNYGGGWMYISVNCPQDLDYDGWNDTGGCLDLDGMPFTMAGNFMTIYELDWPDSDDLVRSLYFDDRSVTLNCPSWDYCGPAISNDVYPYLWEDPWGATFDASDSESNRLVNSSIALEVVSAYWVDPEGYCNW